MKYQIRECEGHWLDDPESVYAVRIALDEWDGIEDSEDQEIFYYMDGSSLEVGTVVSEGFLITNIEEK